MSRSPKKKRRKTEYETLSYVGGGALLRRSFMRLCNPGLDEQTSDFIYELEHIRMQDSGGLFDQFLQNTTISMVELYTADGVLVETPSNQNDFNDGITGEALGGTSYESAPIISNSYYFSFADDNSQYILTVYGEASQIAELRQSFVSVLPILFCVILLVSLATAWVYANVDNYKQNALPRTLVASAMKASMVALPSNDVTNRAKIEPLAVQNLQSAIDEKYNGEPVITIINVNIDDMDFEGSYNQAIAQKQISQMNYEQQQIENERSVAAAKAEAEKKVIEANAEADKKRITAEADAEQARIAAQAEADAIKSVADAQAEANRKLAESVTDALIEYEKVKSWDGKLPKVTDGNSLISFGIE